MPASMKGGIRFDNMVNLGFSFTPSLALSAKQFDKLGVDIRSFREPLKRSIQKVIAPSIGQNFLSNGRPEGWAPYADGTAEMKARDPKNKYGPDDMLRRSGLLWKTMQQYNIWTVTQTQAAILDLPDKIWYGALHQAGFGMPAASAPAKASKMVAFLSPEEIRAAGGAASSGIPARPFAMFQTQDIDKVQEVFADWLAERVAARLAGYRIVHGTVRAKLCHSPPALKLSPLPSSMSSRRRSFRWVSTSCTTVTRRYLTRRQLFVFRLGTRRVSMKVHRSVPGTCSRRTCTCTTARSKTCR